MNLTLCIYKNPYLHVIQDVELLYVEQLREHNSHFRKFDEAKLHCTAYEVWHEGPGRETKPDYHIKLNINTSKK